MKTPLVLAAFIFVIGGAIVWRDHLRLVTVRASHKRTMQEAAKHGIPVDFSNDAGTGPATKTAREDRRAAAGHLAADYIEFAKEKEALRNQDVEPDEAFRKREVDFDNRTKSLVSRQWEIFITAVYNCKELKNGTRQAFFYNSVTKFASQHPQAALAFFANNGELFQGSAARQLVSTALVAWSKVDPLAAMAWIRKNGSIYPDLITEGTKRRVVEAAAFQDPNIAFSLIGELEFESQRRVIGEVIGVANTPEKRTATLTALRGYLATIKDEKSREKTGSLSLILLARQVCQDGFTTASEWISSADLTPKELDDFATGVWINSQGEGSDTDRAETGRWVQWLGETLPGTTGEPKIRALVSNWTRGDFQAAGQWLGT